MGRRNETNRLAHKKKIDQKKIKDQKTTDARKEKLQAIYQKINLEKKQENQDNS